jgi:hypothetical protein
MLRTYRKVTYTLVVTIKNSVVMDKWDNMELFQLARRMLLYKSVQLLVMNERHDRGELLAKVQNEYMYMEKDTIGDVSIHHIMTTDNILRFNNSVVWEMDKNSDSVGTRGER